MQIQYNAGGELATLEHMANELLKAVRRVPRSRNFPAELDTIASTIEGLSLYSHHIGLHKACSDAVEATRDGFDVGKELQASA